MLQKLVNAIGRLYNFVVSLVITVLLGLATWVCWGFYQEASRQSDFAREGQLVSTQVVQVSYQQRSWRDALGSSVYLTVRYRGRPYITRFIIDTTFVSEGDRVSLLYHRGYDAVRQPETDHHTAASVHKSRLIQWSIIEKFSSENKLLLLCLILSTAFFFFGSGLLVTVLRVPFLQDMARLVLAIELFAATVFFTVDAYAYFQYYQRLKTHGHEVTVSVLDTRRTSVGKSSRHGWYYYQADVRHKGQLYTIPISEDDFETVKAGDSLRAIYDESAPDLMSADFSADYSRPVVPAFFGLLTIFLLRSLFRQRGRVRQSELQQA